jgi:hypothetical protein
MGVKVMPSFFRSSMPCRPFSVPVLRSWMVESAAAFMKAGRSSAGILSTPRLPMMQTMGLNRCSVIQQCLTTSLSLLASTVPESCSKPSTTPVCAAM